VHAQGISGTGGSLLRWSPFVTLPTILTIVSTGVFLVAERLFPGRPLPPSSGWYLRALLVNFAQLGITLATGKIIWPLVFGGGSLLSLGGWHVPAAEGFVAWFVGTFAFYWWHRIRHLPGFWTVFHQIHHSPSRIEIVTSFYKHPIEIVANSLVSGLIVYPLLGCSTLGTFWYNFFAATGEYFYHANLRSPSWLRWLIQTPELHSIHHQLDVHAFNYSDLPLWDHIFGTYRDAPDFAPRCGFHGNAEQALGEMLLFRDVNEEGPI
jgi:sterol desaturase/sphingolipid hydroxylase (fatty acid hydroxylase superfamily)